MRQGSETAERRQTERLPVVASVHESIVVLPRTKIWSYRERRGFVYSRCQAQGTRRASLSGNTRERTANVRERRRTTTTTSAGGSIDEVPSLHFFYHRYCGFRNAATAAADVLCLLLLPQKSARSCVLIVGTPFQTWAGKKLQQQQLEWVLVSEMDHEIPMLWNKRKKAEVIN